MQSCLNFVYLAFVVLAVAFMGNFSSPHLAYYSCTSFTVHMLFLRTCLLAVKNFPPCFNGN